MCRGIARIFQREVTVCQSDGTHQIVMPFLPPAVGCLLEKGSQKWGHSHPRTPPPPPPAMPLICSWFLSLIVYPQCSLINCVTWYKSQAHNSSYNSREWHFLDRMFASRLYLLQGNSHTHVFPCICINFACSSVFVTHMNQALKGTSF